LASSVLVGAATLDTDEWGGYGSLQEKRKRKHHCVKHGENEGARDADGDGKREVDCNTCEGAGAGRWSYRRGFRGGHKYYRADYVATSETMLNAKRITAAVVRRMCFGDTSPFHSACT
jgi:hypothetical protein